VNDHLVERGNLRDAVIGLIVGLALAGLVGMVSGCTPQRSANLMAMISMARR
jgi:hypothetical protein